MEIDGKIYKPKVLLVDDNNDNIQLAMTLLRKQDFTIEYVLSGVEALDSVKINQPDLILLDIMMPEMDGFEVCKTLKDNPLTKDIPVIFLSARTETEAIVKGFEIGGADYITKPFKQMELIARINTSLKVTFSQRVIVEQNQKLIELNKDKDLLMQITAHDLKNPISGIAGLLDYIEDNYAKINESDIVEIIDTAKYGLNSAMNIIGDLLDNYAYEMNKLKLNFEIFDIHSIVKKTCQQHFKRAEAKHIRFNCKVVGNEFNYIEADKSKTVRILDNLISNSIKYSPENTEIIVDSKVNDNKITIIISDSGPGFKTEDLQKLFQKYSSLSAKPTGREISNGMGLYISKKLANVMNAEILIENNIDHGAKFSLIFSLV